MSANSIETQVILPPELYQAIQRRAEQQGHSLNCEIVTLLRTSLTTEMEQLEQEFTLWEAASDEDWLNTENLLIGKEV